MIQDNAGGNDVPEKPTEPVAEEKSTLAEKAIIVLPAGKGQVLWF